MKKCEAMILKIIEEPELVLERDSRALMAARKYEKSPLSTAYFTRRLSKWRKVLWQR